MAAKPTIEARFLAKVSIPEDGGCWIWTAAKNSEGYGRFSVNGTAEGAHRVSYELHKGPIPDGLVLDHLCRNTSCVNPDHLEPVTQRTNVIRGNAPTAANAARTECPYGHDYTVLLDGARRGTRECPECRVNPPGAEAPLRKNPSPTRLLTARAASERFRVSRTTILAWCSRGWLNEHSARQRLNVYGYDANGAQLFDEAELVVAEQQTRSKAQRSHRRSRQLVPA